MMLHDARREARVDDAGSLVSLDRQDRSRWDWPQIEQGLVWLARALRHSTRDRFLLEASIAAAHVVAPTAEETDWAGIEGLYRQLMRLSSSPVIALNHAVAVAMSQGLEAGLARMQALSADQALSGYRQFYTARAELLRRLDRSAEALPDYEQALAMTSNEVERRLLTERIDEIRGQHQPH
jgi:RNA polymerase sigma-70 factor (ECF subfamily)